MHACTLPRAGWVHGRGEGSLKGGGWASLLVILLSFLFWWLRGIEESLSPNTHNRTGQPTHTVFASLGVELASYCEK